MVLQHKIEDVVRENEFLWKSILGLTTIKEANKDGKGNGTRENELATKKDVCNDLHTLKESLTWKVKESEKYTIRIEDVHTDKEETSVLSSQE